jgi:hypothetical protein
MKTFPKCQGLQECGCGALQNLTFGNVTGQEKAIESGGIELLLPALDNHLDSAFVCERACLALFHMGEGGKKNTWLLLRLGGGAALAKVSTKSRSHEVTKWLCPDTSAVQTRVRKLGKLIVKEMKAWVDEE